MGLNGEELVLGAFEDHARVLTACRESLVPGIVRASRVVGEALRAGNKIMLCGNGGSAADSQHIAAEMIGRFKKERAALAALALTTDSSILTCVGNDYSYQDIFSRQVRGLARAGDVLIGISTSGNSPNVLDAVVAAREAGCVTIGLAGHSGGKLAPLCDHALIVPSRDTARIQEMHIMIGHLLCELIDQG